MSALANKTWTEEAFVEAHAGQLKAQDVPKHLWKIAYEKLAGDKFDAGESFTYAFDPDVEMHLRYEVMAKADITKEEDLWLIEHIWLFKSAVDALKILKQYPQVMDKMLLLTGHDKESLLSLAKKMQDEYGSDCNESADQSCENDTIALANQMIDELQRYAYPLIDSSGNRMHYVMDELGSRVRFCVKEDEKPNVKYATIFNQMNNETVTLMWCIENSKSGDIVLRSPQHRMSIVGLKKEHGKFDLSMKNSMIGIVNTTRDPRYET